MSRHKGETGDRHSPLGTVFPGFRLGISSYAYRYSIGFEGFASPRRMTATEFVEAAHALGLKRVQLCENLHCADMDAEGLSRITTIASSLGVCIELGMRGLTEGNLERHLEMAGRLSSSFLRIVLGGGSPWPEQDSKSLKARSISILKNALPAFAARDASFGIENHFDLPTRDIVAIVEAIGSDRAGLVFDTTNGLGFLERPEETLALVGPHLVSVHLKDYVIQKVEAGYLITGTPLGRGLLNLPQVLGRIASSNPQATIVLEMSIRRGEGQGPEETVAWESSAIHDSIAVLNAAVGVTWP